MARLNNTTRLGQSLVEILIGMGLTVVVMLTAMSLLQFLLRMSAQDPIAQTGAFLAYQTMRAVTVAAEGSWFTIAKASQNGGAHRVVTNAGRFALELGPDAKTVNTVPYTIEITVRPVNRGVDNKISATTGVNDPSTKKVIIKVSWMHGGGSSSNILERYVTRARNEVIWQTDWVGGPTVSDAPVSVGAVTTQFRAADNAVDYLTVPGSIKVKGL